MSTAAPAHPHSAPPLPETLPAAHELIQALHARLEQADWQIAQLRKSLYGPTSERVAQSELSPEQVLLSLFPAPEAPPATQDILPGRNASNHASAGARPAPTCPAGTGNSDGADRADRNDMSARRESQVPDRL